MMRKRLIRRKAIFWRVGVFMGLILNYFFTVDLIIFPSDLYSPIVKMFILLLFMSNSISGCFFLYLSRQIEKEVKA